MTPKLSYFEMRGRAEATRVLLHATSTDFDDHRVVSSEEWGRLRSTLPFGSLPIYESSVGVLCESHAILRHLGRELALCPEDEAVRTCVDAAHDAIAQSQEDLWRFNWRENYFDQLESYANAELAPRLRYLESWLSRESRSAGTWFGEAFGPVDCVAFCYLDEIDAFFPALLSEFKTLATLRSRVASLPGVSEYLASAARPIVFGIGQAGPKVDPRISLAPDTLFANPWSEPLDLAVFKDRQRRLVAS